MQRDQYRTGYGQVTGSTNRVQHMQNNDNHMILIVDQEETGGPCQRNGDHEEEHKTTEAERYKQVVLNTEHEK